MSAVIKWGADRLACGGVYRGVEVEGDVLVVAGGGERHLGKGEVILGARQGGVQHQHVALHRRGGANIGAGSKHDLRQVVELGLHLISLFMT